MLAAAYGHLLRIPRARVPLFASIVGRLPIATIGLASILLVQSTTGSFASAGAVDAFATLGAGFGLPAQGRIIDRLGQTAVLIVTTVVQTVALVGLVVAARGDAPVAVLCAIALVAGATFPPISQCMRVLWPTMVGGEQDLHSAYALDAVIIEVVFITGPLIVAALAAAISPSAAILGGIALTLIGVVPFAASRASREWRPERSGPGHWAGPLRSPGIWVLAAGGAGLGWANGALAIDLTAFGSEHASPEIAGPLISIQALASLVGGLWYGARSWRSQPSERYALLLGLLALGFAPLIFAQSVAAMAVLIVLAGFPLAPATTVEFVLVDRLAPPGTSTEAFGWVLTATVVGSGMGAAAAGAIVNQGQVELGLVVAFAGGLAGAAVAILGRRHLRSAPAEGNVRSAPRID